MATVAARLLILAEGETVPAPTDDPGAAGAVTQDLTNQAGGTRWTDGQGSGEIDRVYKRVRTMTSGETQSYDLAAAGGLTDALARAIDADELKCLALKCTSGSIALEAPASAFIPIFSDASDVLLLSAGQTLAIDFGAAGLDVTSGSKFDIVEKAAGTAGYVLELFIAQ
jgi:hypothetical protein